MKQKSASRREKISKAGSTVFIAVAIAAAIIVFSAVSLKFLLSKKSYNDRVITAKSKARDDLQTNLTNIETLVSQFPSLESSPTTSSKIVLHALPPNYDYAALVAAMESLAQTAGARLTGTIGSDTSAEAVLTASASSPQEIPLTLTVNGSYDQIVTYIQNLQSSIRPVHVDSVTFTGTNNNLKAELVAKTYYQPARSLEVEKVPIQ